jgi:hypothetical protein
LAVPEPAPGIDLGATVFLKEERASSVNHGCAGCARSQPEHFVPCGQAVKGKPRSEPDWGKLTVRDRREARGNVAMGAGLRPSAKVLDKPPDPTVHAPRIYPDFR